jgi:hypothetical protein
MRFGGAMGSRRPLRRLGLLLALLVLPIGPTAGACAVGNGDGDSPGCDPLNPPPGFCYAEEGDPNPFRCGGGEFDRACLRRHGYL